MVIAFEVRRGQMVRSSSDGHMYKKSTTQLVKEYALASSLESIGYSVSEALAAVLRSLHVASQTSREINGSA